VIFFVRYDGLSGFANRDLEHSVMIIKEMVVRKGEARTGSGSCPVMDFAIRHAEPSRYGIKLAFSTNIKIVLKYVM
jgi:hypothetical protein